MFRLIIVVLTLTVGYTIFTFLKIENQPDLLKSPFSPSIPPLPIASVIPETKLITPPPAKTLPGEYQVFQTFNNCGPAALSMALSYYGVSQTQQELGYALRPYQIAGGINDDKSVTLEELAQKAEEYGLTAYHRPGGNIELIKLFIGYDIPIIARTLLKKTDDIGHYRVVKGYEGDVIIQDDSLQGKNLRFSQVEFNALWEKFNFEYLVLIPADKKEIAKAILKENFDPMVAWNKAVELSWSQLSKNPADLSARFNLSVAYYNLGEYQKSVDEFEKVENQLPFRTLWYQIEPIRSYERVFEITQRVLNNYNLAFSELYLIRGEIYQKQGNLEKARSEFEKAYFYNKNLPAAKQALDSLN